MDAYCSGCNWYITNCDTFNSECISEWLQVAIPPRQPSDSSLIASRFWFPPKAITHRNIFTVIIIDPITNDDIIIATTSSTSSSSRVLLYDHHIVTNFLIIGFCCMELKIYFPDLICVCLETHQMFVHILILAHWWQLSSEEVPSRTPGNVWLHLVLEDNAQLDLRLL